MFYIRLCKNAIIPNNIPIIINNTTVVTPIQPKPKNTPEPVSDGSDSCDEFCEGRTKELGPSTEELTAGIVTFCVLL
jgi:hypothetical protein